VAPASGSPDTRSETGSVRAQTDSAMCPYHTRVPTSDAVHPRLR
jgi:hypothetical protein